MKLVINIGRLESTCDGNFFSHFKNVFTAPPVQARLDVKVLRIQT